MKNIFLAFIFCALSMFMLGQGTQFNFAYGNNGIDRGKNITEGPDGNFYIVGSTSSSSTGNTDILVLCIDENGAVIWSNSYGSLQTDIGIDLIFTGSNELLVLGQTNGYGDGGYDIFLTKLAIDGGTIWEKTFGGEDWEFAWDLQEDQLGNYYIAGETYSYGQGNNDAYLLKVNDSGDILFEETYGTNGNELFRSMDISDDGDLVCIGDQKLAENEFSDAWLMKLDSQGSVIWDFTRDFGTGYDEFGHDIAFVDNQIIAVSNFPDNPNQPYSSYWRLDEFNDFLWERTISNEVLVGLLLKNNTEFVMVGETITNNAYWFYMKQDNGWPASTDGGPSEFDFGEGSDSFSNAANTMDGGFICVGATEITDEGLTSVLVTKFDSLLTSPQEIELANLPLGITMIQSASSFKLYPIPSTDKIYIQSNIQSKRITYEVKDLKGSIVTQGLLVDSSINIQNLNPSMYFVTLFNDGISIGTGKLIVE